MKKTVPFDAACQQLRRGVNLIEASAGTGKTYAIAMLALRFVVEKKVPIENILVVTFTNAATKELRGRIRQRLAEAKELLSFPPDVQEKSAFDPTLKTWAQGLTKERSEEGRVLLQQALYSIDQAPVFTIHGFCQRMLSEQALESNQPFDSELLLDLSSLLREIAEDYWRNVFYLLEPELVALLTSEKVFTSPSTLLASVIKVVGGTKEIIPQSLPLAEIGVQVQQSLAALRSWWLEDGELFFSEITAAGEGGYFKGNLMNSWQTWIESLRAWCLDSNAPLPRDLQWLSREGMRNSLNGTRLRGAEKQAAFIAPWHLPAAGEKLQEQLEELFLSCRVEFAHILQKELSQRLLYRGEMGFDDLVTNLAEALKKEENNSLQRLLADRFTAALIDEFQDTDENQYAIFSRLFGGGRHFLYLIGDPKQAIYSFRGADIHSYFTARSQADNLFTLEKNYRSHPLLIAEINRLFKNCTRTEPFRYPEEIMPFHPVQARCEYECQRLLVDEASKSTVNGMVYWLLPPSEKKNSRWGASAARDLIQKNVIAEIGRLLSSERRWQVVDGESHRPLAPRDIAILVRNNIMGEEYSNTLADAGIPAVVTSRISVFTAPECRELLVLLSAVLSPSDSRRCKAALALSWLGLDGGEVQEIFADETRYTQWQLQLLGYGQLWQRAGFFSMISTLFREKSVFESLAQDPRGERRIANIRQLCVLAQEEVDERSLGPLELYQWLLRQHSAEKMAKESELLLESDREAVQIVTMHSAKGLEYGIVFCVDLWGGSDRLKTEKAQILCRNEQGIIADLGSDKFDQHRQQAQQEQQAEELRLLYVAVTRAKMRCYIPWADVQRYGISIDSFTSSLGYLLFPKETSSTCDHSCQQAQLHTRAEQKGVSVHLLTEPPPTSLFGAQAKKIALKRRFLSRRDLNSSRSISSFTSLAGLSEYEFERAPEIKSGQEGAVLELPSGPRFGNVVHDLFEQFPFADWLESSDVLTAQARILARRYGVKVDVLKLTQLLRQVVTTPLQPQQKEAFSLAQLSEDDCVKEIPFYFAHEKVNTDAMCRLLADDPVVVPLGLREIAGYLTGFVDLLCRWQGRYYIIDYKTNNLGDSFNNYQQAQLAAAMRSHNYGLQYWIYTVVLHRYLSRVVKDYRYECHFGGVFYLFARGMTPAIPGNGLFFTRPAAKTVQSLDSFLGRR